MTLNMQNNWHKMKTITLYQILIVFAIPIKKNM